MADLSNLRERASLVRHETAQGGNTAERVGRLLEDIVDAIGSGGQEPVPLMYSIEVLGGPVLHYNSTEKAFTPQTIKVDVRKTDESGTETYDVLPEGVQFGFSRNGKDWYQTPGYALWHAGSLETSDFLTEESPVLYFRLYRGTLVLASYSLTYAGMGAGGESGSMDNGNFVVLEDGSVKIKNALVEESMVFHRIVTESSENGMAIANATATMHTSLKGDIFIVKRNFSTFEVSFPPAYLFPGAQVKVVIGAAGTMTYELSVNFLSGEGHMFPADQESAGWPPYNCFYAAVPVTSYGVSGQQGRAARLQFSSNDYHVIELISTQNIETGQSDYYYWMVVDAR